MKRLILAGLLLLTGCATSTAHLSQPVQFAVFFNNLSAELTPSGQKVIAIAAKAIKDDNPSRIDVTGHADGGGANNLTLADQRAATVITALAAAGVNTGKIAKLPPDANDSANDAVMAHKVMVTLEP